MANALVYLSLGAQEDTLLLIIHTASIQCMIHLLLPETSDFSQQTVSLMHEFTQMLAVAAPLNMHVRMMQLD
jgi:hypothetical protein